MFNKMRNLSKSTVGTIVLFGFLLLVVASFALADLSAFNVGGGGGQNGTLATAGDKKVTDRDMSRALERQLGVAQQQDPEATYADLADDFDPLLQFLIDQRVLAAFGEKHGIRISKRLIDAEIAKLPGVVGLDGQVTQNSYNAFLAQNGLSDAEVRELIASDLTQRLMVTPITLEQRVPSGFSQTYASMLLERRVGNLGLIPTEPIAAAIDPSAEEVATYYRENRSNYIVPEQRRIRFARFDADRFQSLGATPQEIADALEGRQGEIGTREVRILSQVVVPTRAIADEIVARTANDSFADAVAPAGFSAADVSIGPQTRAQFRTLAGEEVAAAVFANDVSANSVVGPVRSPFGWHVVKVDGIETEEGESEADARAQAAQDITTRKRQDAMLDLVADVEDALRDGASMAEAVEQYDLELIETPLVSATGRAPGNSDFTFPPDLRAALSEAFELLPVDDPEVVATGEDGNYAMVDVIEIVEPAAAPLSEVRERVRRDLIASRAERQASALATRIMTAVRDGTSMADAIAEVEADTNLSLPDPEKADLRRLDLTQFGSEAPPALRMLFRLSEGAVQIAGDPEGRGVFIVELVETEQGNALNNPDLVTQTAQSFLSPIAGELQQQFLAAVANEVEVERNEDQIRATRTRIVGGSGSDN